MRIEIDDIIGNAFVSYLQETGKRTLTNEKIKKFALSVVNYLCENGKYAYLDLSENLTNEFFCEYEDWFKSIEDENGRLVVLNNEITVEKLVTEFSEYLSLDVLLAFRNPENIKVLLEEV